MSEQPSMSEYSPPVDPAAFEVEQPERKWPTVIGVISLIYAICGLMCQSVAGAWVGIGDTLPEIWRGGIIMPPILRAIGIGQIALTLIVGVIMLLGSIRLLRRQRSGPSLLRKWVVLRISLVLFGVIVAVLTAPAQIQMQRSGVEWQKRYFKEHDIKQEVPEYSDQQLWHRAMIGAAVTAGLGAIYPTFLGIYLSRKKLITEVEQWR